jgi:hypothetical protein
MPVSIKQHFKSQTAQDSIELKRAFDAVQADLAALRTSIVAITAQLDADGGITGTDFAANNDPAALTLIS